MILWLRERFSWMGTHSGYDQVCEAITKVQPGNYLSVWREPNKLLPLPRISTKLLVQLARNVEVSPFYDLSCTAAEVSALGQALLHQPQIIHINYVENNLGILPKFKHSRSFKLVGTAHQPASWWRLTHPHPKSVCGLNTLIVPSKKEVSYFEQFLPGRVYFVPHGVDTTFFHPDERLVYSSSNMDNPRCIFSGTWLRDISTLANVIDQVIAKNPKVHFDIIIPRAKRNDTSLHRIARHEQVFWHADLSDEQLRRVYQQATLFFLPLLDCTANNALLEAMACGLPIISNDIGGLPDYTTPEFSILLPPNDADGFTEAILKLVDDPQKCQQMGAKARSFTEQNFNWARIAQQTLDVYQCTNYEDCLH